MQDLRIVFMGTPEFAVPSLDILVKNNFNVVAAITAPDKPKGRGRQLAISPVKAYCIENNIPVLQPTNLKNEDFLDELRSYQANLQVVVAFRMLPEMVWDMPSLGTFNLHASLLPDYRGAAPINWAIINGENQTGVTTFFLEKEIDTGEIIFQQKETIHPEDNAGSLYQRLMTSGAELVLKTANAIQQNNYSKTKQNISGITHNAPKIHKETCQIQWNEPAVKIHNFVRGLSPYPAAWTVINDQSCKIFKTEVMEASSEKEPGSFWVEGKEALYFQTGEGIIRILELQMQGKNRMRIDEFLRGNSL